MVMDVSIIGVSISAELKSQKPNASRHERAEKRYYEYGGKKDTTEERYGGKIRLGET